MRYVFLTGTNRGLGQAAAETFKDSKIISITRSSVEESENIHKAFSVDFSNADAMEKFIPEIFNSVEPDETDEVYLLNVAGIVDPVKSVSNISAEEMMKNYTVNVVAPTLLIQGFINRFKTFGGEKRIVTVTSGAARGPVEGWSIYCSSKAAVNMIHSVLDKEVADTVAYALSQTFNGGTTTGLKISEPAAAKTGTTNFEVGASWLAGFTRGISTAVWTGDPEGTRDWRDNDKGRMPRIVFGDTISGPSWQEFMQFAARSFTTGEFPNPGSDATRTSSRQSSDTSGQAKDGRATQPTEVDRPPNEKGEAPALGGN